MSQETAVVAVKHYLRQIEESADPLVMAMFYLLSHLTGYLAGELYLVRNAR